MRLREIVQSRTRYGFREILVLFNRESDLSTYLPYSSAASRQLGPTVRQNEAYRARKFTGPGSAPSRSRCDHA
jgi:hypothetical protein